MSESHRKKKVWLHTLLRIGGSALALALLFQFLPVDELWRTIRRVDPRAWLLVLVAYIGAHLIAMLKWRMMVNLAGAGLNVTQAARCYFAGLFGNVFLPSLVGGDVVRAGLALRLGRSKAGVLFGSLLDRMLDMTALGIVATTGILLVPGALDPHLARAMWRLLGLVATAGVLGIALLLGVLWLLRGRFSYRMRRRLVRLRKAVRSLARQPLRVGLALALGVTFQLSLVVLVARLAIECGLFVPLRGWMFAYPVAKLSALLPVTQGGIGVREAALAVLLVPFGAPPVLTVATGLVWETIIISTGLLGGLFSLFAGRPASATQAQPAQ